MVLRWLQLARNSCVLHRYDPAVTWPGLSDRPSNLWLVPGVHQFHVDVMAWFFCLRWVSHFPICQGCARLPSQVDWSKIFYAMVLARSPLTARLYWLSNSVSYYVLYRLLPFQLRTDEVDKAAWTIEGNTGHTHDPFPAPQQDPEKASDVTTVWARPRIVERSHPGAKMPIGLQYQAHSFSLDSQVMSAHIMHAKCPSSRRRSRNIVRPWLTPTCIFVDLRA